MGTVRGRELSVLIAAVQSEELGKAVGQPTELRNRGAGAETKQKISPLPNGPLLGERDNGL